MSFQHFLALTLSLILGFLSPIALTQDTQEDTSLNTSGLANHKLEKIIRTGEITNQGALPSALLSWRSDFADQAKQGNPPISRLFSDSLENTYSLLSPGPAGHAGWSPQPDISALGPSRTLVLIDGNPIAAHPYPTGMAGDTFSFDLLPFYLFSDLQVQNIIEGSTSYREGAGVFNGIQGLEQTGFEFKLGGTSTEAAESDNEGSFRVGWDFGNSRMMMATGRDRTKVVSRDDTSLENPDFTENHAGAWTLSSQPGYIDSDIISTVDPDCEEVGGFVLGNHCATSDILQQSIANGRASSAYTFQYEQDFQDGGMLQFKYSKTKLSTQDTKNWLSQSFNAVKDAPIADNHPGLISFLHGIEQGLYEDDGHCAESFSYIHADDINGSVGYDSQTSELMRLGVYSNGACQLSTTHAYDIDANQQVTTYSLADQGVLDDYNNAEVSYETFNATELDSNFTYTGRGAQISAPSGYSEATFHNDRGSLSVALPLGRSHLQTYSFISDHTTGWVSTRDELIQGTEYGLQGLAGGSCSRSTALAGSSSCTWLNPFSNSIYNSALGGDLSDNPAYNSTTDMSSATFGWLFPEVRGYFNSGVDKLSYSLEGNLDKFITNYAGSWSLTSNLEQTSHSESYDTVWNSRIFPCEDSDLNNINNPSYFDNTTNLTVEVSVDSAYCIEQNATDPSRGALAILTAAKNQNHDRNVIDTRLAGQVTLNPSMTLDASVRFVNDDQTEQYVSPTVHFNYVRPNLTLQTGFASSVVLPSLAQLSSNVRSEALYLSSLGSYVALDYATDDLEALIGETIAQNYLNLRWQGDNLDLYAKYLSTSISDPIVSTEPFEVLNDVCPLSDGTRTCDTSHADYALLSLQEPNAEDIVDSQWDIDQYSIDRIRSQRFNGKQSVDSSHIEFGLARNFGRNYPIRFQLLYRNLLEYSYLGEDRAGRLNADLINVPSLPSSRLSLSLDGSIGFHSFKLVTNHISSYSDQRDLYSFDPVTFEPILLNDRTVDAHTTFDVFYNFRFRKPEFRINLSVYNLTDQAPPVAQLPLHYDPNIHNPFGRTVKLNFSLNFR